MPRKISKEKIKLMLRLYGRGLSCRKIASQTGVNHMTAYGYTILKQRINPETNKTFVSLTEYFKYLSKQKGFNNNYKYRVYLDKMRQSRPLNKKLSGLIIKMLEEMDKPQKWLAYQIGVTKPYLNDFISGRRTPTQETAEKLFSVLQLPYKNLDELLTNNN